MVRKLRVHDLIQIDARAIAQICDSSASPEWVEDALGNAPWVVVRRAQPSDPSSVAIGIRGSARHERYGTEISKEHIVRHVAPHEIAVDEGASEGAFAALEVFATAPFVCGPGGSVGFELVTGVKTTHQDSDLDLVVFADSALTFSEIAEISDYATRASSFSRVDIVVETPLGGVAFAELERASHYAQRPSMMLRTDQGPELTNAVWR